MFAGLWLSPKVYMCLTEVLLRVKFLICKVVVLVSHSVLAGSVRGLLWDPSVLPLVLVLSAKLLVCGKCKPE